MSYTHIDSIDVHARLTPPLPKVTTSDYLRFMKAVGVKDLKARLSEYLRAVRAGETLLITDRTEVVAELRPATRRQLAPDSLTETLDALAESGDITRARAPKAAWHWKPVGLGLADGTAAAMVAALRNDRDEP
jgi:prevent-host-death family protein